MVLTDIVIDEIVKLKKYTVIDRANRDKILAEVGFQMTGCVDESCTIEAGRLLGVGKMVVGKVGLLGGTYIVSLQLLNVETAAVENSSRETCRQCELDNLILTTANATRKLFGKNALTGPPDAATDGPREAGEATSVVYIFRSKKSIARKCNWSITIDSEFIGELENCSCIARKITPGTHKLRAEMSTMICESSNPTTDYEFNIATQKEAYLAFVIGPVSRFMNVQKNNAIKDKCMASCMEGNSPGK